MPAANDIDGRSRSAVVAADEDGTDQIGSDTPHSGVATPQPDLHDKRLPGIMSYFNQVRPASFKRLLSGTFSLPPSSSSASTSSSSSPSSSSSTSSIPPHTASIASTPHTSTSFISTASLVSILSASEESESQKSKPELPACPSPPTLLSLSSGSVPPVVRSLGETPLPVESAELPQQQLVQTSQASQQARAPHNLTSSFRVVHARQPSLAESANGSLMASPVVCDLLATSTAAAPAVSSSDADAVDLLLGGMGRQSQPSLLTHLTTAHDLSTGAVAETAEAAALVSPPPLVSERPALSSCTSPKKGNEKDKQEDDSRRSHEAAAPSGWDAPWTYSHKNRKEAKSDIRDGSATQQRSSVPAPLEGIVTESSVLARHFSVPHIIPVTDFTDTRDSSCSPSKPMGPPPPRASTAREKPVRSQNQTATTTTASPSSLCFPLCPTSSSSSSVLRSASVDQLKKLTSLTHVKSGQSTPTRSLSTARPSLSHPAASPTAAVDATRQPEPSQEDETAESRTSASTPTPQGAQVPTPRGKLTIKISEARGLRRSRDPYVVAVFQRSELISGGPRSTDGDEDAAVAAVAMGSIPIQRQASDNGRPPMAIPMRSRQSSNTSMTDFNTFRNRATRPSLTNPKWDAEAVFDVVDPNMLVDISVYDHSPTGEEFLGHVNFQAKTEPVRGWFPLVGHADTDAANSPTGEIHVESMYQRTDRKHYGPDDFEILRLIGKGTFGQVYQVRKKDTKRIYAMKVLSKKKIVQKKEVAHTVGERNILVRTATSDSPFIVGLKFSFQTPSDLYLVTDYMSGGELFWHLQKEGRFEETRAKFYIAELILAIEHLHNNDIVYRDLKPENILLDANGHIALCDFGLSKANLTKNDTTNTFCGTTEYLAPEVLLDEAGYTKMVDFWSLGVLVFEMCCGWSPFYAEDTQQMYKNIAFGKVRFPKDALSTEGRSFVKGLLNRNPKHRLGATKDAAELMEHPFFRDIDWNALSKKLITPPFKPQLKSDTDVSYFDPLFTNAMDKSGSLNERAAALARGLATSTPLSPSMQANFQGFTFVDESALEDHMRSRGGHYNGGNDDDDDEMDDAAATFRRVDSDGDRKEDPDWDDLNDLDLRRASHMSGIVRTNTDEQLFGTSQFDM